MPLNYHQGIQNTNPSTKVARLNMLVGGNDDDKFTPMDATGVADIQSLLDGDVTQAIWAYNGDQNTCNVEVRLAGMQEGEFVPVTLFAGEPFRMQVLQIRRTNTDAEYIVVVN